MALSFSIIHTTLLTLPYQHSQLNPAIDTSNMWKYLYWGSNLGSEVCSQMYGVKHYTSHLNAYCLLSSTNSLKFCPQTHQ